MEQGIAAAGPYEARAWARREPVRRGSSFGRTGRNDCDPFVLEYRKAAHADGEVVLVNRQPRTVEGGACKCSIFTEHEVLPNHEGTGQVRAVAIEPLPCERMVAAELKHEHPSFVVNVCAYDPPGLGETLRPPEQGTVSKHPDGVRCRCRVGGQREDEPCSTCRDESDGSIQYRRDAPAVAEFVDRPQAG